MHSTYRSDSFPFRVCAILLYVPVSFGELVRPLGSPIAPYVPPIALFPHLNQGWDTRVYGLVFVQSPKGFQGPFPECSYLIGAYIFDFPDPCM